MVAAMLRKQGVMQDISVLESEVEAVIRDMVKLVGEGGPDL